MFGDTDSAGGDDKSGDGGDVKGAETVAAGAAGVEQGGGVEGSFQVRGAGAHGASKAEDLFARFTLHAQSNQECGNLGSGRGAFENEVHRLFGFGGGERVAGGDAVKVVEEGHRVGDYLLIIVGERGEVGPEIVASTGSTFSCRCIDSMAWRHYDQVRLCDEPFSYSRSRRSDAAYKVMLLLDLSTVTALLTTEFTMT